jgi:hypothetical protein
MSTAFALAGLGGNNAHGAGFLAAAQELQRRRQESVAPDAPERLAGHVEARRTDRMILPELEFISCTSGAIAPVLAYLQGKDVRAETENAIAELDRATWLPRNAYTDPWRPILVTLFTGVPGVFGPWAEAFSAHLAQRVIGFFDRTSPYYGAVPTTYEEFADLWLPARAFVPKRPQAFFDKAAEVLDSSEHGVGVAFNSFDPKTGIEQLYVNARGMELIREHHDEDARYGRTHGRTVYQRITPDGLRNALWLFYYGFPAAHLGADRYVDGAYARSIILNELTGAERIYAVKPVNDRWLGRLPQNLFEVADMQTEFWMEASYREQYRLITTINDLKRAGRLPAKPKEQRDNGHVVEAALESRIRRIRQKKYKDVELIPVEIAVQRGFFTYFVEDREVFRDAYGQALRVLMERDEDDARRARDDASHHTAARAGHRV